MSGQSWTHKAAEFRALNPWVLGSSPRRPSDTWHARAAGPQLPWRHRPAPARPGNIEHLTRLHRTAPARLRKHRPGLHGGTRSCPPVNSSATAAGWKATSSHVVVEGGRASERRDRHRHPGPAAVRSVRNRQPEGAGGVRAARRGRAPRRQRTEEPQNGGVLSGRGGQRLIGRAVAPGALGERPVVLPDTEPKVMTMHPHAPDGTGWRARMPGQAPARQRSRPSPGSPRA